MKISTYTNEYNYKHEYKSIYFWILIQFRDIQVPFMRQRPQQPHCKNNLFIIQLQPQLEYQLVFPSNMLYRRKNRNNLIKLLCNI